MTDQYLTAANDNYIQNGGKLKKRLNWPFPALKAKEWPQGAVWLINTKYNVALHSQTISAVENFAHAQL